MLLLLCAPLIRQPPEDLVESEHCSTATSVSNNVIGSVEAASPTQSLPRTGSDDPADVACGQADGDVEKSSLLVEKSED